MIETPMTTKENAISHNEISEEYPNGWGKPIDVANLIVFLLSDKTQKISGQNYIVDLGNVLFRE